MSHQYISIEESFTRVNSNTHITRKEFANKTISDDAASVIDVLLSLTRDLNCLRQDIQSLHETMKGQQHE